MKIRSIRLIRGPINKSPFAFSLAITSFAFLIFFLLFSPQYQVNDDVRHCMIASGVSLTDVPDAHILYPHIFLGEVLTACYTTLPAIPWYGLMLYVAMFWGTVFWLWAFLKSQTEGFVLIPPLILFLIVLIPMLQFVQYTMAACWLMTGSWFLFRKEKKKRIWLFAGLGMVLGSMIRWESFLLIMILVAVEYVWDFRNANWKERVMCVAGVFLVAFGLHVANNTLYETDTDWSGFHFKNSLQREIIDYNQTPFSEKNQKLFKQLDWDKSAYALYESWFLADTNFHSTSKLTRLVKEASPISLSEKKITYWLRYNALSLFLIIPIFLCFPFLENTTQIRKRFLILFLCSILLLLYFLFLKWLQPRVTHSVLAFVLAGMLLHVRFRNIKHIAILLLLAGSMASLAGNFYRSQRASDREAIMKSSLAQLNPQPHQLFAVWSDSFPYEYLVKPLGENREFTQPFQMLELGLTAYTPLHFRKKEKHGIRDIHEGLKKENVFLIARPELLSLYEDFLWKNYDRKVRFREVMKREEIGLWVWKVE